MTGEGGDAGSAGGFDGDTERLEDQLLGGPVGAMNS